MNRADLYRIAADLLSEDGEAPEYDRGVINLVAELDPIPGRSTSERMVDVEQALESYDR